MPSPRKSTRKSSRTSTRSAVVRGLVVVLATTAAGTLLGGPLAGATTAGGARPASAPERATTVASTTSSSSSSSATAAAGPLTGVTIALDPGHQLGNHNFPQYINRLVPAGGFSKPCNTTGTATNGGVAEATVNYWISRMVQGRLEALGATVRATRLYNRERYWGPCVDVRGEFGKRVGADLEVSLHADGAASSAYGFHVIAPTRRSPWTTDIATSSLKLAGYLRNSLSAYGVPRSSYIGNGTGLDVRSDLATLNMSDVPIAMIEVGNMRNSTDAARMLSAYGRARYANAVVHAVRAYLRR